VATREVPAYSFCMDQRHACSWTAHEAIKAVHCLLTPETNRGLAVK